MANDSPDAFFSYCRADAEFAIKLAQDLKSAGANVWLDQIDIELGTPWDLAVEGALNKAPCLLVILSPVSVDSQNVRDEVSFALSKQKRVIPILYRECDVPFRLARLQRADFSADYARGFEALTRALSVEQPAAATATSAVDSPSMLSEMSSETPASTQSNAAKFDEPSTTSQPTAMSQSAEQRSGLPQPDTNAMARVEQAIKEIDLANGWIDKNSVSVWRKLSAELSGREVTELCHILNSNPQSETVFKVLILLNYSVGQPAAVRWHRCILASIESYLTSDVQIQQNVFRLLPKLHVDRADVWKCLFESLQMAQSSSVAAELAKVTPSFTPPEKEETTGALLLDLLFLFDDTNRDMILGEAIEALNYRSAIPRLCEAFDTCALRRFHYKAITACKLLAKWDDKGSVPYLRKYIDAMYKATPSTNTYFFAMESLYSIEGTACAEYIADRMLNSSPKNQNCMFWMTWQPYENDPVIMNALGKIEQTTQDRKLKEHIGDFIKKRKR